MSKKNILIIIIIACFLYLSFCVFATFVFLRFNKKVDPPYFRYSMGEIFEEVSVEEGKTQMNFQVYDPEYVPSGFPGYKIAIRVKPENEAPEIYFFTPHFPGTEDGISPTSGIKIAEYPLSKRDSSELEGQSIIINGISARLDGPDEDNDYKVYFQIKDTAIDVAWFGKEADKEELIKIAESIIPKK